MNPNGNVRFVTFKVDMRRLCAILAVVVAGTVQAGDTFPVIKTTDGQAFTNAEVTSITAAYLVISYEGGGTRLFFTNLSPEIQKKYGFDPVAAAAAEKAMAVKRAAAAEKTAQAQKDYEKLAAWTGDTYPARIIRGISAGGYQVQIGNERENVAIQGLPTEISSFVSKLTALSEDGGASAGYGSAHQGDRILATQHNASVANELSEMRLVEQTMTAVLIAPTKLHSGALPVWRYMGKPAPRGIRPSPRNITP